MKRRPAKKNRSSARNRRQFVKIMGEAGFGRKGRQGRGGGHDQALQLVSALARQLGHEQLLHA